MRAVVFRSYGGPLELAELPKPSAWPGEVLVKVAMSSVNPIDWKRASGKLRLFIPVSFPSIPGFDLAGEVVEVGAGVTGFSPGMKVHARKADNSGACAEYATVKLDVVAPMPEKMDMATAAGLPLAGITALQGLRNELKLRAGDRVLIVGASGGVGQLAVQVAKALGGVVVGVCSSRNLELVRGLGADEVVDYTKPEPYQGQAPFDAIYDCVGGDYAKYMPLLTPKGRYASCVPGPGVIGRSLLNWASARAVKPVMLKASTADLKWLDELFVQGKLKVVEDSRFALAELSKAWERSQSGRAVGKILIEI